MCTTNAHPATGEEAIRARELGGLDGPMDAAAAKLVLGMKLPVKDRRRAYALGQRAQKREQSMVSDNQRCQDNQRRQVPISAKCNLGFLTPLIAR